MTFRRGETESFPVDSTQRSVWYGIIEYDPGACRFQETTFTASKSGKKDLVAMIRLLTGADRKFVIVGVWQGQWKTDVFVLEPAILIKRMRGCLGAEI
jgi:hypothetical protein